MNTKEALRAILERTHIDDEDENKKLLAPLQAYLRECPYIGSDYNDAQDLEKPFGDHDGAYVITRLSPNESVMKGKDHVRRIRRSDGKNTFTVPARPLSSRSTVSFVSDFFRQPSTLDEIGDEEPDRLGRNLVDLVDRHLLIALLSASEGKLHGTVHTSVEKLRKTVIEYVNVLDVPATVLVGADLMTSVLESPRFTYEIGNNGKVEMARQLGPGVVLVVANQPEEVGFIRVRFKPVMFAAGSGPEAVVSAVGEFGFCVWSDSPVWKIDTRGQ